MSEIKTNALTAAIEAGEIQLPEWSKPVADALEAGQLRLDIGSVKATLGSKTASAPYVKTIPTGDEWLAGALALTDGDATKVSGLFWYGFDLGVRNNKRPALLAQLEGPQKIMDRTAKDLVAAGLYDTVSEALEEIKKGRIKKGLPV